LECNIVMTSVAAACLHPGAGLTNLWYADFILKLLDRITADDRVVMADLILFAWLFGAGLFVVGNWWMCNGSCANSLSCLWRLSRYARIILPLYIFKQAIPTLTPHALLLGCRAVADLSSASLDYGTLVH
jgi:hypothetical protein